jgi:steroid delta-isomerase-like uncharacterized protein
MADLKQTVRQGIEFFNQGKIDDWAKTLADDAELVSPLAGRIAGRDAIKAYFTDMRQTFPDARLEVKTIVAEGNAVAVEYIFSGTNKGPARLPNGDTVPPTNKRMEGPAFDLGVFDNEGRLTSLHQYFDTARAMQQLGLAPAPAAAARS